MEDLKIPSVFLALIALSFTSACVETAQRRGGGYVGPDQGLAQPTPYPGQNTYPPQVPGTQTGTGGQVPPPVYPGYPTPTPTVTQNGSQTSTPGVVEFHIPAGTGSSPWNTKDSPVEITLGSKPVTLRIINDDSTPHILHTNGAPCPHQDIGRPTQKGQSHDCVIRAPFDSTGNGVLYDHGQGEGAWFYVRAKK